MKTKKIFLKFIVSIVQKYQNIKHKKEIKYPELRKTYLDLYNQLENSVSDTITDIFKDLEGKGEYFWEEKALKEKNKFKLDTYLIIRRLDYLAIKDKYFKKK